MPLKCLNIYFYPFYVTRIGHHRLQGDTMYMITFDGSPLCGTIFYLHLLRVRLSSSFMF